MRRVHESGEAGEASKGGDWRGVARRAIDKGSVFLFFGLVGFAALPMGANRDWAWAPLSILFGLMAVPVALGVGTRDGYRVPAAERGPLLLLVCCWFLFAGFSIWQTTTWTPLTADAWMFARAAEILGEAHVPIPAIAADAARNSLLKCLACALIFLTARSLCRDRKNARWSLVALVASGVLVVSYGIAMQVSTNSCYLGSYLRKQFEFNSGDRCLMGGTFVNSNSFACYMGMCAVAALALLFGGERKKHSLSYGYREEEEVRLIDWLTIPRVVLLSGSLLMLGGLLISASRAGAGASVAGMLIFGLLMARGRWRSPTRGRAVFVLGIAAVLVVGIIAGNALIAKFAAASDDTSRLRIWSAAFQAIGLSPWLGWGLGGFGDIFALLQPSDSLQPNDVAHSTPLETIVELGVIAAIPAFLVVLLPWVVCLRGALRRRTSRRYLPVAAFSAAAVSILHSLVDFSLQIPAIGFMTAALLGMGWVQSFGRRDGVEASVTPEGY
ncbi:O-antigen ligase family protein [Reyranella sp.]|uniref:O-antigen ligase family protein n=1 Tax=Reyranella sp. TaxID=1929291 RepID=UPI003BAC0031